MTNGPSMMLREDLVDIVARTQQVLKTTPDAPLERDPALEKIGELFREKGLLEPKVETRRDDGALR